MLQGDGWMSSKNRLTVNLSDEEATALDKLSEKSRVSKAWLGRHAICSLLASTQGDNSQLPLPLTKLERKGA
jgi:predicted transcriptional regulator